MSLPDPNIRRRTDLMLGAYLDLVDPECQWHRDTPWGQELLGNLCQAIAEEMNLTPEEVYALATHPLDEPPAKIAEEVKAAARLIDSECWVDYWGQPSSLKHEIYRRRGVALAEALKQSKL